MRKITLHPTKSRIDYFFPVVLDAIDESGEVVFIVTVHQDNHHVELGVRKPGYINSVRLLRTEHHLLDMLKENIDAMARRLELKVDWYESEADSLYEWIKDGSPC